MKLRKIKEPKVGKVHPPFWQRLIRIIATVIGGGMALWGFLPFAFNRISNVGVWVSVVLGAVLVCWGLCPSPEKKREGWRWGMGIAAMALIGVFAVLFLVLSSVMVGAAINRPAAEDATVIVLGAKINGRSPSLMLKGRLDVAYDYLTAHPGAMCIVSGGQGSDEECSEARVMAEYLWDKGISEGRVLLEERSASTEENLQFSMELIREKALSTHVVIATQEFHQYRAAVHARRVGASSVGAATCISPWHLMLCYWVRECAAICRLWLLGY